jgi:hypothetical protein
MEDARQPVSVERILRALSEAGDKGILAGDLARSIPPPRPSQVNTVLRHLEMAVLARRSAAKEESLHYRRSWSWRWFITAAGQEYLDGGCQKGAWERARQSREQERLRLKPRTVKLLRSQLAVRDWREKAARVAASGCRVRRDAAMRSMRADGMTWKAIGELLGVSGERVRQVVDQTRGTRAAPPCQCGPCRERRLCR